MDNGRRNTIKMLLAGIGATFTNQTLLNIAQASKLTNTEYSVKQNTFSQQQYYYISQLSDVILPATQTPSATKLALPQFVSEMFKSTLNIEQQEVFLKGLTLIMSEVSSDKTVDVATDELPSPEYFLGLVSRYFSLTAKQHSEKQALIQLKHKGVPAIQKLDYYRDHFLLTLRTLLIVGFICHETIATVLQDPRDFPQPYQPGNC